jgi:hypothetical protein
MKVDSVDIDKNEAYIAKKETSSPLFEMSYNNNGFVLANENDSIEFYNIGITEVPIPTNVKEETYIIKDGKYDLVSLKAVLNDWMNGNNKDNYKILEDGAARTLVDIKLINVEDGALTLYTQEAAKSGNNYLGKIFFLSDDINNEIVKDNLKLDDFTPILYEQNIVNISHSSVFNIDDQFVLDVEDRASNALTKDGINEDIVWAFETDKLMTNITYGNMGVTYRMVCFTSNGNYYEYVINALSKDRVLENDTPKFDVEQERKVSVLTENLDLYE